MSDLLAANERMTRLVYGAGDVRIHHSFFPATFAHLFDDGNLVIALGTVQQPWGYDMTVRHEMLHVLLAQANVWDSTCLRERHDELRLITREYPWIGSAHGAVEEAAVILLVVGGEEFQEAPFEKSAKWLHHPVLERVGKALWLERCRLESGGVSAWLDAALRRILADRC
ncbi:MAG: hypothetical protein ACYS8K_04745 [Planctomycetota bacterium]